MNCLQVRARLAAYVSGDLSAGDAAAVEAHLEGCTFCRSQAAAFERCENALGVLGAVEEAPDLSEDLRGRIAAPLRWRPRWGMAGAVAGAAVVVTALAVLLLVPQEAPVPSAPVVREEVARPAVVSMPEVPDVTAEILAETPPAMVSAPHLVPAGVVLEQGTIPAVVSVPVQGQPAGLAEEAAIEAGPAMASLTPHPERAGGVVLLLGQPKTPQPASSCYLEVSLPDGARSVFERVARLEPPGAPRVIQIRYEHTAPQPKAQD
jgi:hypothetical protein